eukprot:CAMPEP_0177748494 /NCGR_PEP_ID=MMETSP0484_2-20121128/31962_1 /TAXON_ID=354590 /ORGANISM="Rhodomonas lens, Strain RHODO" /LENGTH=404 /DNA_ID=CAMNT_0019263373 /DNA_START=66 /DNA_END=1279 /DNA_ORIENTATION=-
MVSEGVCSSNAVILKQIAELTANCKSAASHHAHPGAHHHEHGHHEHQSFMLSLAHPWHHFLKEFSELITVVFHTLAVLTVAAGGVTAFFIAAELGIKWLICQVKALAGDQDSIKKAKDETKKHDRQLNKLRHKLCGSIALGLNFLLAAEVTEQLAADHKETALEAVTEAAWLLVVVRAVIGYEANKEQEEAKEALEHGMEVLASIEPGTLREDERKTVLAKMMEDPIEGENQLLSMISSRRVSVDHSSGPCNTRPDMSEEEDWCKRAASAAGSNASGGLGNVPEAAEVTAPKKHAVIEPQEVDLLSAGSEDPKALDTLDLRRTPSEQQIKERHDDIMHGTQDIIEQARNSTAQATSVVADLMRDLDGNDTHEQHGLFEGGDGLVAGGLMDEPAATKGEEEKKTD